MEGINPHGSKHHFERGNVEGSWTGMKKRLEQQLLCSALQGRVTYHFTKYTRYGSTGDCASVCLDGQPIKKFGFMHAISQLKKQGVLHEGQYPWDVPMQEREEYELEEFTCALKTYRNQPIAESLQSSDPIVRMFAIVDRRVGKRTLSRLRDALPEQPEWLRKLYLARMQAEHVIT